MERYKPVMSFDEVVAEVYDDLAQRGDEMATVAFLEQLARGGPALELAIGTGRIALPFTARGIQLDGIDFSSAMIARLRLKPGGAQIAVTLGNFADVAVPGAYRLIYVVFNTLFNLLTQDEQVRCFENVAAHLTEDGSFVVEGAVARQNRPGLDWARNLGIKEARHSIVAFIDDDALAAPGWLRGLAYGFRDPGVMVVTGLVLPAELESPAQIDFETYGGMNKGFSGFTIHKEVLTGQAMFWASG